MAVALGAGLVQPFQATAAVTTPGVCLPPVEVAAPQVAIGPGDPGPVEANPNPVSIADPATVAPVDTATVAPVDTATAAPVDTATAAPVDTATVAPVDTATIAPSTGAIASFNTGAFSAFTGGLQLTLAQSAMSLMADAVCLPGPDTTAGTGTPVQGGPGTPQGALGGANPNQQPGQKTGPKATASAPGVDAGSGDLGMGIQTPDTTAIGRPDIVVRLIKPTLPQTPPPLPHPAPLRYGTVRLVTTGRFHNGLKASFIFSARPTAGARLRTTWYYNNKPIGTVLKRMHTTVTSSVQSSHPLPAGYWRCTLRVKLPGGDWRELQDARQLLH